MHLAVVNREVHNATAKIEQSLARISVTLVLFHRIFDGLFGESVLQLKPIPAKTKTLRQDGFLSKLRRAVPVVMQQLKSKGAAA